MHDSVQAALDFPNAAFSRVFIRVVRCRNMIWNLGSTDCLYEEGIMSSLCRDAIKSELGGFTIVVDER